MPAARAAASGHGETHTPIHSETHATETHEATPGEHGEAEEESDIPELTNIIIILNNYVQSKPHIRIFHTLHLYEIFHILHIYENFVFFLGIALILVIIAFFGTRNLKKIPTGFQAFLEFVVIGLEGFFSKIIGSNGRPYLPLCGTIFLFVLFMNLAGMIPLAKSPIALNINVPLSVALCVFFFVHYHGIRQNGIVGYINHYIEPLPLIMAPITILLVVIHIISEITKPLTLTLRLFGNITAEDIVIAALLILGVGIFAPLQIFFFPLALLFSFIQALIFSTLTAVYIGLMMAHETEHEESHLKIT